MSQKSITINNVKVDVAMLENFLNDDQKVEAIIYISHHCKAGLKEAKDFVDNFDSENFEPNISLNSPLNESVQFKLTNDIPEVRYYDIQGNETLVNPEHPLWHNVKRIMIDSLKLKEYEDDYYRKKATQQQNTNPITIHKDNSGKLLLIVFIVVGLVTLLYFLIS